MVSLDKQQELNKWWTKGRDFYIVDADLVKYNNALVPIKRASLEGFLDPGKIVIIKGPRRAGKTMSIKRAIFNLLDQRRVNPDDIFYFSFEETITGKDMDATIRNFLVKPHPGQTYLFLDEIQSIKNWAEVMLGLANSGALKNTSVVITGSIAHFFNAETLPGRGTEGNIYFLRTASFRTFVISLLERMKNDPGGRMAISNRLGYTFSAGELDAMLETISSTSIDLEKGVEEIHRCASAVERYFIPLSKMFDLYVYSGGYPASINDTFIRSTPQPATYEEIYNYIKNDAATITKAASGDPLKAGQAVSGILKYVGKKVSYSKIARDMSMNKVTLIDYYDRLENSFVFLNIKGVKFASGKLNESEVKKFYFSDIFMHYAAGAAGTGTPGATYAKEMVNSSAVGAVAEEIVAGHLIRVKELDPMRHYSTYVHFYDGKKEIDFLYKRDNDSRVGIEVKYQGSASTQDIKTARGVDDYVLLAKSGESSIHGNKVVVPLCVFLAALKSSDHNI